MAILVDVELSAGFVALQIINDGIKDQLI